VCALHCIPADLLPAADTAAAATVTLLLCYIVTYQPDFEAETVLPLPSMPLNEVGQCFSVLRRPAGLSAGKMGCVLKFTVKEIDPSTGEAEEEGYEDEYQVRSSG
jgi:hypothetical protein